MRYLLTICALLIIGTSCKSKVTNTPTATTFKDVDVAEANAMIAQNDDLIILDVRTPEETALGTIPNAIVIDIYDADFDAKLAILNKSKPYLVYCKAGSRSVSASEKMIAAGFSDVSNLKGGYMAWSK